MAVKCSRCAFRSRFNFALWSHFRRRHRPVDLSLDRCETVEKYMCLASCYGTNLRLNFMEHVAVVHLRRQWEHVGVDHVPGVEPADVMIENYGNETLYTCLICDDFETHSRVFFAKHVLESCGSDSTRLSSATLHDCLRFLGVIPFQQADRRDADVIQFDDRFDVIAISDDENSDFDVIEIDDDSDTEVHDSDVEIDVCGVSKEDADSDVDVETVDKSIDMRLTLSAFLNEAIWISSDDDSDDGSEEAETRAADPAKTWLIDHDYAKREEPSRDAADRRHQIKVGKARRQRQGGPISNRRIPVKYRHFAKTSSLTAVGSLRCRFCDSPFPRWSKLRRHVLYVHAQHVHDRNKKRLPAVAPKNVAQKPHKCTDCNFSADTQPRLDFHHMHHHWPEERRVYFHCVACSYKTKYKWRVKDHYRNIHATPAEIEWVSCDLCSYKGKSRWSVKDHKLNKHVAQNLERIMAEPLQRLREEEEEEEEHVEWERKKKQRQQQTQGKGQ